MQYLRGKIKVDGKVGNLGDHVRLQASKTHVTLTSGEDGLEEPFCLLER